MSNHIDYLTFDDETQDSIVTKLLAAKAHGVTPHAIVEENEFFAGIDQEELLDWIDNLLTRVLKLERN